MSKVDFKQIASAALSSIDRLLDAWLPDGRREGHEFKARNPTRIDNRLGSFSVNLKTGAWADFADADPAAKGGDLISLYGYLHNLKPLDAAREVAAQLGIDTGPSYSKSAPKPAPAQAAIGVGDPAPKEEKKAAWVAQSPVPENAPPPPVAHIMRGKPERSWTYRDAEGRLLGFIWRFKKSDGGKDIVPLTFCKHSETGAYEWRNVQFADPRPLYVPGIKFRDGFTRLIVEGEKCADAAHGLVADRFDVATWPGGGKAIEKVDWSRFVEGDKVIIWPDCDAQQVKFTKAQIEEGLDQKDAPLLEEHKQPGMVAAEKIAAKLQAQGCEVRIVKIPAPGEKPSGWDVADAIADGWSADQVKEFVLDNLRKPAQREESSIAFDEESISTASTANAEEEDQGKDNWYGRLFKKGEGLRECRENVYQLLMHMPQWQGCLGLDEFSNVIKVRKETPTGLKPGDLWDEQANFQLGLWMAKALRLFLKAEGMITAGVRAAAVENTFHPVREWLDGLEWDGKPRVDTWLSDYAGVERTHYSDLVGRLFLIGMVARIYQPGCKMDSALILEGLQGEGKSSIARALAGEWFADTPFQMGDKDSFQALSGKWMYELAELDSFNRAEATRAKAFISSPTDRYRAPYDTVTKDWPRQCVFMGTTNQYEYFKDSSGNRRYWPVLSIGAINPLALKVIRHLLFAEAVQLYKAGEHWWPTKEQQNELISPEQEKRELQDVWEIQIQYWLENSFTGDKVDALEILTGALKMEISKIDGAKQSTMRVGNCMHKLGWEKGRETSGKRRYFYIRPKDSKKPEPMIPEKREVGDEFAV